MNEQLAMTDIVMRDERQDVRRIILQKTKVMTAGMLTVAMSDDKRLRPDNQWPAINNQQTTLHHNYSRLPITENPERMPHDRQRTNPDRQLSTNVVIGAYCQELFFLHEDD